MSAREQVKGEFVMCDVKKYRGIFREIQTLSQDDTLQLILDAKTQEERDFYSLVGNFLLQNKQKAVVREDLF